MAIVQIKEQQKEVLVKISVGIAMVFACYFLTIHPSFPQFEILRRNLVDSKKKIEIHEFMKTQYEKLSGLENSLASLQDRSVILGKISDFASKEKIDIQGITPRTQSADDYVKLNIEIEGKGTFFSLTRFLKALEEMQPVIGVRDISALRQRFEDSKNRSRNLQVHLILETYLKQKQRKPKKHV